MLNSTTILKSLIIMLINILLIINILDGETSKIDFNV